MGKRTYSHAALLSRLIYLYESMLDRDGFIGAHYSDKDGTLILKVTNKKAACIRHLPKKLRSITVIKVHREKRSRKKAS